MEKLCYNEKVFYKFLSIQFGGKKKWETLFHNGVLFPPEYKPHNIPLKYKDEYIKLNEEAEEYAMLYVKYFDTEYIKNKTFNKNFWKDWKKIIKNDKIETLEDCDFTEYRKKYLELKQLKKEITEEEKNMIKQQEEKYKIALLNGKEEEVGNFRIEPPGLFIGRGNNPNIGRIKKRIYPEDVIINIGKNIKIPEINMENHKWGKIIHDKNVEWIASWKDNITNKIKYVWLGHSSEFKANNDYNKFELARKLKRRIKNIQNENLKNLKSPDIKTRQLATALYLIDKFAIRVGNEKSDNEADTVGVTTLRLEHITLNGNNLELSFLGKDSVPYYNSIEIEDEIKDNIKLFMENKEKYEQLFDKVNSSDINAYLQSFIKNLTAKTFRSYNASYLFQKEITKIYKKYPKNGDMKMILMEYNKANIKVAKLLNHQKNIGKSHKTQIDKINEQIKNLRKKFKNKNNKKVKEKIKNLKEKKNLKDEMKNLALGTSKENYIDPRITVAYMKYYDIPVEKIFTKKLQKKFKWAFDTNIDFVF